MPNPSPCSGPAGPALRARTPTDDALDRLWDLGAVVRSAMRVTKEWTELQRSLSTPAAAPRLRLLADLATDHAAEIITATARAGRPVEDETGR